MRAATFCLVVLSAFAFARLTPGEEARAASRSIAAVPPEPYGPLSRAPKPKFEVLSGATCAAAACHGGGKAGCVGSEYTTWAPDLLNNGPADPHARAYRILFNKQSVSIARGLGIKAAHKEARCLKCHATENSSRTSSDGAPAFLAEGVGCAACHGAGGAWAPVHVLPSWKGLSNREKEELGYRTLSNLVNRSLTCAGCHVGDGDRDMNHDLIAAGHPRLALMNAELHLPYEYTAYHFQPQYRHHWTETRPLADFTVRAWVCGQAATLRTAVELLQKRAESAVARHPGAAWPEFSGYSCFACHQRVGDQELRRDAGASKRPAGSFGWELWTNTTASVAAELSPEAYPAVSGFAGLHKPDLTRLAKLRKTMEARSPDPRAVVEQARDAILELDGWLAELQAAEDASRDYPLDRKVAVRFMHSLAGRMLTSDGKLADHDWDVLASGYSGCRAMSRAAGDPVGRLSALEGALRFPLKVNSPAGLDRNTIRMQFQELYNLSPSREERP